MSERLHYQIDTFIEEYDGESPVVIFGTGDYGQFIFDKLSGAGIVVRCFTSNSKSRHGTTYCNVEVRAPASVTSGEHEAIFVIAVIDAYNKGKILRQLLDSGVERERIVVPIEPLGGLFSSGKIAEIPEFAEAEKRITLESIKRGKDYFVAYFLTNGLTRLAMPAEDELSREIEGLLSGSGVEIRYVGEDGGFDGFDAVLLTDRENYIFLEEALMDRMGGVQIPVINFWTVVKRL